MFNNEIVGCGNLTSASTHEPRNILRGCVVSNVDAFTDCPAKGQPLKVLPGFSFGATAMDAIANGLHGLDATNTQAGLQIPARLAAFPVGTAQDTRTRQLTKRVLDESRHHVNSGLLIYSADGNKANYRPWVVIA